MIYGYDSEILGDLDSTLRQLTNCVKKGGYIILEFMFAGQPTEGMGNDKEMKDIIEQKVILYWTELIGIEKH